MTTIDGDVTTGGLTRNWHLLPRAARYVRPYRGHVAASICCTLVLAVIAIAQPWPLAFVVDVIVDHRSPPAWVTSIAGDDERGLVLFGAAAMVALTLIGGLVTVVDEFVTTHLDLRVVFDLRRDLFRHALRLSPTYTEDRRLGTLLYRTNDEADSLGKMVLFAPETLRNSLTLIGMLIVALRIDAPLALVSLGVVPLVVLSTRRYGNRIEPHVRRTRLLELGALAIVQETISMVRVVTAFGRESDEHRRFRAQGEEALAARLDLTLRDATFRLLVSLITAAGNAFVLGFGAYRVVQGHMTAGELLVMLAYVAAVYAPLRALTNTMTNLQQRLLALRSMLHVLDAPPDVVDRPGAVEIDRASGRIEFDSVSFGYPHRGPAVRAVSFEIQPGETIGLVGATGAGKTTLVNLAPRYLEVSSGSVRIDGLDVRLLQVASLRRQFAVVLQEPLLFPMTIRENIRYGRLEARDDEIEQAARDANAHDFVTALPDGYDTVLGERGGKLSGGERQRISIARAFLRDAPILILDEPTSSIDSRTEAVILDALDRLRAGRTTIMIAHRLSTVRDADRVLVLEGGRLVEQGTFDELLQRGGSLARMWEAQQLHHERTRAARAATDGLRADGPLPQVFPT